MNRCNGHGCDCGQCRAGVRVPMCWIAARAITWPRFFGLLMLMLMFVSLDLLFGTAYCSIPGSVANAPRPWRRRSMRSTTTRPRK
ncbi:MAG: hypothetical protein QM749_03515 [Aquabacterium sp.]